MNSLYENEQWKVDLEGISKLNNSKFIPVQDLLKVGKTGGKKVYTVVPFMIRKTNVDPGAFVDVWSKSIEILSEFLMNPIDTNILKDTLVEAVFETQAKRSVFSVG